ncbi:MAG: hypothetical protein Tsb0021_14730 [Chlamydiales bacterium]
MSFSVTTLWSYPDQQKCRENEYVGEGEVYFIREKLINNPGLGGSQGSKKDIAYWNANEDDFVKELDVKIQTLESLKYYGWFWQSIPSYIQKMNARIDVMIDKLKVTKGLVTRAFTILGPSIFFESERKSLFEKFFQVQDGKFSASEFERFEKYNLNENFRYTSAAKWLRERVEEYSK